MQYKRVQEIILFLISATIASNHFQINGTPFVARLIDPLASTAESCADMVLVARYANTAFAEETQEPHDHPRIRVFLVAQQLPLWIISASLKCVLDQDV